MITKIKPKVTKEQLREIILRYQDKDELNSITENYDYSEITDMNAMFESCSDLKIIPLIDTSNVTDMSSMFADCENFKTIPLLDTSNVTRMCDMFFGCKSLKTIPLFDTSKVINIAWMFFGCSSLETVPDLNIISVSVSGNARYMFDKCSNIKNINPYNFKYVNWADVLAPHIMDKYPELYI
jgi:surface protein